MSTGGYQQSMRLEATSKACDCTLSNQHLPRPSNVRCILASASAFSLSTLSCFAAASAFSLSIWA
jgi:hypothetical protein